MSNKVKYLFKNVGLLTISNFASKILIFFLVPLYTSILSTTEYGIYDLVLSTIILLYPILTLNIVDAVMRFSMDNAYSKKIIASIAIKYISFSAVIVTIFLLINSQLNVWKDIKGLEVYVILYYVTYCLNQFFIQFAKGLERVIDMGVAGVLGTVMMILSNIIFLVCLKWGLAGFFIANIFSQVITIIYFSIRLKIWSYITFQKTDKKYRKEMLIYCTPLIATTVGWWVNSAADKYVVSILCGLAINGTLSVAYKIPQILNTFQNIFIQAWQISAIKEYGETESKIFYGKTFVITNFVMCLSCSLLIFLDKVIAKIMYANTFYEAWRFVPFLLISCVVNCAAGMLGPILAAKKDSKSMAVAAICGALVNIILNIIFVLIIGPQGATIATVISSYIIFAIRKRAVGDDIVIEKYSAVLVTWFLLCIQAVLKIYFDLRGLEIILMFIIIGVNFRAIVNLIKIVVKLKK